LLLSALLLQGLVLLGVGITNAAHDCTEFVEGSCELDEYNIIRNIDTVSEALCQKACADERPECEYFTYYKGDCWLLRSCTINELCEGCVSGPYTPPLYTQCPWPPRTTPTPPTTPQTSTTPYCGQFKNATCELLELNVIEYHHGLGLNLCQEECQKMEACAWFTWFKPATSTMLDICWLLRHCEQDLTCPECVSGPQYPDVQYCS